MKRSDCIIASLSCFAVLLAIALVWALTLSGCSSVQRQQFANLGPADQAATVGIELSDYYRSLHQQALYVTENGDAKQRQFMVEKVNPILNKVKNALVLYQMAVLTWKSSGEKPAGLDSQKEQIQQLLQQAANTIIQIINSGGG